MRRVPMLLLLIVLVAFTATSCSKSPLAPTVADGTTAMGGIQIDDPPVGIEGQAGLVGSTTFALGEGGTVQAGRFRLLVPKNALRQAATITLRQPDPDVLQVEFEVTPASANHFAGQVTLIADCSNDPLYEVQGETLYWNHGAWTEAAGVVLDRAHRTLQTKSHSLTNAKVDARQRSDRGRNDN